MLDIHLTVNQILKTIHISFLHRWGKVSSSNSALAFLLLEASFEKKLEICCSNRYSLGVNTVADLRKRALSAAYGGGPSVV